GLAAVPVFAAGFVWWQRRVAARGGDPLLRLPLFADGRAGLEVAASGLVYAFQAALFLALSLYLQQTLHATAAVTGLILASLAAAYSVSSLLGRRLAERHGYGTRLACTLIALAGIGVAIFDVRAGVSQPVLFVVPLVLIGAGTGLLMTSITALVLSGAPAGATSRASGVLATVQQFAVALAVTITGLVLPAGGISVVLGLCAGALAAVFVTVAAATDKRAIGRSRIRDR
uniref:MFS transporter n=1 Tax=Nonomuraea lactucae TaxID=2249762 RepID=UPI0013B4463E